jgi:hypothetical protein
MYWEEKLHIKLRMKSILKGAHEIIGGTNHALNLVILYRSVGARHLKLDIVREKESVGEGVIKLVSIITLDASDDATKLYGHKDK